MRIGFTSVVAVTVVLGGLAAPAPAQQRKKEPLVDQVKRSIDLGVQFLKREQLGNGSWEVNIQGGAMVPGGWTALTVLALLNAGVPANDRAVERGLDYLRNLKPSWVYVRALQTMVYAEAGQIADKQRIVDNVKWLLDARQYKNNKFLGWSYKLNQAGMADGSNDQYAILGLIAGRQGGAEINKAVWEGIRDLYLRRQENDGGWPYSERGNPIGGGGSSLTMTEAGVCNLLIAAMELNIGCQPLIMAGRKCGEYPLDKAINRGLSWISTPGRDRFVLTLPQRTFYNLYGIERVGRFSGNRFLGQHDWYREGSEFLVQNQDRKGYWKATGAWDQWEVVSTSFALLFLSKGRTPVLMSKLVHGDDGWPRDDNDSDWNNDRNDLRHLTEFASRTMFEKKPLAWQTFDLLRAAKGQAGGGANPDDLAEVTSELLASPIAYFNGHKSPLRRFTQIEQNILKQYLENGGFLFVEACCASPQFDAGFKALAKQLWPDSKLEYLAAEHPVWTSYFKDVTPGRVSKLMGLNQGCKTVLIYSPQDLSCAWEANKLDNPLIKEAFYLGGNIIHYATGLELPAPRGTKSPVSGIKKDSDIRRGFFKVGQLKHRGDSKPAPRAMPNLMDHMHKRAGMDVVYETEELSVFEKRLIDYKFLYMHGRGDIGDLDPRDLDNLRFNLENGGLLLADACCGSEAFDKSFRKFAATLFPPAKYPNLKLQRVPLSDELFSADLNGEALTKKKIQARTEKGGKMHPVDPWLEGIKINNRWVILYSKYDIGCALEKHRSADCVGYDSDSAFRLASAAVLYTLRP